MVFEDIQFSLPPRWFFDVPPAADPLTLPPPSDEPSFKAPLHIDPSIYNKLLSPQLPITFAIAYFAVVTICNAINRRRGNKPLWISSTALFKVFVILHNLALAVYSGITCAALVRTLRVSWPGWQGTAGLAGAVDALCKMHGPRGFGDAVTYNPAVLKWTVRNELIHLGPDTFNPDYTDVGRIWNEGLAFWGWLFYLSKYYEVVDTIIILLKGKRATTLQKYHHAGALLCMWAGIRYMSPPIWMFVLVNSGIHTLMYTFYTASVLGIKVPRSIRQSITTLQIAQLLVGASFASAHLFISYRMPGPIASRVWSVFGGTANAARDASSSMSSFLSYSTVLTPYVEFPAWLKRLAYRAAGAEGLAENVRDRNALSSAYRDVSRSARRPLYEAQSSADHYARRFSRLQYRPDMIRCIDTSGQAFAIWLNVLYLAPLTGLFLRFFWKSYVFGKPSKRTEISIPNPRRLSESAEYAARRTSDTIEEYGIEFERSIGFGSEAVVKDGKEALENTRDMLQKSEDTPVVETVQSVNDGLREARQTLGESFESMKEELEKAVGSMTSTNAAPSAENLQKAVGSTTSTKSSMSLEERILSIREEVLKIAGSTASANTLRSLDESFESMKQGMQRVIRSPTSTNVSKSLDESYKIMKEKLQRFAFSTIPAETLQSLDESFESLKAELQKAVDSATLTNSSRNAGTSTSTSTTTTAGNAASESVSKATKSAHMTGQSRGTVPGEESTVVERSSGEGLRRAGELQEELQLARPTASRSPSSIKKGSRGGKTEPVWFVGPSSSTQFKDGSTSQGSTSRSSKADGEKSSSMSAQQVSSMSSNAQNEFSTSTSVQQERLSSSHVEQESWTDIQNEINLNLAEYMERREERGADMVGQTTTETMESSVQRSNGAGDHDDATDTVDPKKPSWGFGLNE